MVQIVVKQSEDDQFLFEAPASSMLDEVIPKIVELHNLRKKIERLTNEIEKLASGKNSEDEENSKEEKKPMLPDTVLQNIDKTIDDARIYLSKVRMNTIIFIIIQYFLILFLLVSGSSRKKSCDLERSTK